MKIGQTVKHIQGNSNCEDGKCGNGVEIGRPGEGSEKMGIMVLLQLTTNNNLCGLVLLTT